MSIKFRTISVILLVFLLGSTIGAHAESYFEKISAVLDKNIKLRLYGNDFIPKDSKGNEIIPINYNGSTYLPLRSVAEAVGLPVEWDNVNRTATLGYTTIQLNNYSPSSFVDININGGFNPTYLTPTKKTYNNWFMGVTFEVNPMDKESFETVVANVQREIKKNSEYIDTSPIELSGLSGQIIEYGSYSKGKPEPHTKIAILQSNNSEEYYVIKVFIESSKYEENENEIDKIMQTFRKQI